MYPENKKIIEAIEKNNTKYINNFLNKHKEYIINAFDDYLFYSENSDNINFISNFLNLFVVDNILSLNMRQLEHFNDFLNIMIKEKNYSILNSILKQEYLIALNGAEKNISINRSIIFDFILNNDKEGLKIGINNTKNIQYIADIATFCIDRNPSLIGFILENFKWIKAFKQSQEDRVINHPEYIKYKISKKVINF